MEWCSHEKKHLDILVSVNIVASIKSWSKVIQNLYDTVRQCRIRGFLTIALFVCEMPLELHIVPFWVCIMLLQGP